MTCSSAKQLAIWSTSYGPQGAGRVRLAPHGTRTGCACHPARSKALCGGVCPRSGVPRGRGSRSPGPCLDARSGSCLETTRGRATVAVGWSSSAPGSHWRTGPCSQAFAEGRAEGTTLFLGRRGPCDGLLGTRPPQRRQSLKKCLVPPTSGGTSAPQSSQDMRPTLDYAEGPGRRKKKQKPLRGGSSSI